MYNEVIDNVKSIIREKGIKQRIIAERAGFSEKKFSNLLNGRYVVKAEEIPAICRALEVSPNELFSFISTDSTEPQTKVS